jgi:hypothetical protein
VVIRAICKQLTTLWTVRLDLKPRHIVGSIESAVTLANNGFGIGLLPAKTGVRLYGQNLVLLNVNSPAFAALKKYTFSFVCRKDSWKTDSLIMRIFAGLSDLSVA